MGNFSSRRYPNKPTLLLPPPRRDAAGDRETLLLYKWKIEGFSNLLDLGSGDAVDLYSGVFEAGGYTWMLHVMTKSENGKSYISLRLCLDYALSDSKVEAKYNLLIYDQKHSKHIKERGIYEFINTSRTGAFHYMIPLETFKNASSGFLINDSCIFGVEILRVLHTSKNKVVSEYLSLCTGKASLISYTWNIGSCRSLQNLESSSEAFSVDGLKWYITVYLDGGEVSVSLNLDEWDAIQIEPGVYVEASLCMKDQKHGKHMKTSFCKVLSLKCNTCGWSFPYEYFSDPSDGFFVNNTFTIEASISVVGSVSYDEN